MRNRRIYTCDLCEGAVIGSYTADAFCESCGQKYAYDEAISIVLSDEQWALLRAARPRVITRVMDDGIKTKDGAA